MLLTAAPLQGVDPVVESLVAAQRPGPALVVVATDRLDTVRAVAAAVRGPVLALVPGGQVDAAWAWVRQDGRRTQVRVEAIGDGGVPLPDGSAASVLAEITAIPEDALRRALAPGGDLVVRVGGTVRKVQAPPIPGAEMWSHPDRDARSMRSTDRTVLAPPLGLRWIDGIRRLSGGYTDIQAILADHRHLYTLGLGPEAGGDRRLRLTARDAYAGLPAWHVDLGPWSPSGLHRRNARGLVLDGATLHAITGSTLVAIDPADGRILRRMPLPHPAGRMLQSGDRVLVATWAGGATAKGVPFLAPATASGAIVAFSARAGTVLWQQPLCAVHVLADESAWYAEMADGRVIRGDLADGRVGWTATATGSLQFVLPQGPVLIRKGGRELVLIDRTGGTQVWSVAAHPRSHPQHEALVVDGTIRWGGRRLDPATGRSPDPLQPTAVGLNCSPGLAIGGAFINPRDGSWFSPRADGTFSEEKVFRGMRGGCLTGMILANDLFYTTPNYSCTCQGDQLPGTLAIGPAAAMPADVAATAPAPPVAAAEPGWSTLRGGPRREGRADGPLAANLVLRWSATPAVIARNDPLGDLRAQTARPALSPPLLAAGLVVVADVFGGRIHAVAADTGAPRWTVETGSRLLGPPTLHRGLCIAAGEDGGMGAWRIADGGMAWRVAAAPGHRLIVDHGQFASTWPAAAAVLAEGDRIYAVHGRSTAVDGGLSITARGLDGTLCWRRSASAATGWARGDALRLGADGDLIVGGLRLGRDGGRWTSTPQGKAPPALVDSLLPAPNTREAWRGWALVGDRMLAVAGDAVVGISIAADRPDTGTPRPDPLATAWDLSQRTKLPDLAWRARVPGLAGVVVAGDEAIVIANETGKPRLVRLALADGSPRGAVPLPAPAVPDGIAIHGGRVAAVLADGRLALFAPP